MQERDQSRAAFINEAEFLLDPGADLACRTRQRRAYPRRQIVFLLGGQIAGAPANIEAGEAFDPALFEELAPAADRVVVQQQCTGDLLAVPSIVQKHQAVRAPRHPARRRPVARHVQKHQAVRAPRHPARRRPVARQRRKRLAIFFAEEARLNHARIRILPIGKRKKFLPALQ